MQIHLYIFVTYLVAYLVFCVNATIETFSNPYEDGEPVNNQNYCRYKITDYVFFAVCQMMSLAMLILFIYLSVSFSAPVSDEYRTKVLLLFHKKDLHTVREVEEYY